MTELNVVLYGPVRGPERLLNVFSKPSCRVKSLVVVRYACDTIPSSSEGLSARTVFVDDPGPFLVEENAGRGAVRRVGTSNGRRQFAMIRAGLDEMADLPGSEAVLVVRSDLDVHDEDAFSRFLTRSERLVMAGSVRFARLTVNSVSPFSFTGHKLHGSDWLFITTLEEARRLYPFDPAVFAVGNYGALDWIRKGDFCFGAFSAEQLFNLCGYLDTAGLREHNVNALTLPWHAAIRFLRDNCFITPADAGVGLSKWRYLYDPTAGIPHPFGSSIRGIARRHSSWLLFWSELVPASGDWFWANLAAKALLSWIAHSAVAVLRATRLLLHLGAR